MPRRHDGLFEQVASFPALADAARRALKGRRRKPKAGTPGLNEPSGGVEIWRGKLS